MKEGVFGVSFGIGVLSFANTGPEQALPVGVEVDPVCVLMRLLFYVNIRIRGYQQ